MSGRDGLDLRVALYEGPGSVPLSDDERFELLSSLLDAGYDVTRVVCGCGLSSADASALLVLGRFDESQTPVIDSSGDAPRLHFREISELYVIFSREQIS